MPTPTLVQTITLAQGKLAVAIDSWVVITRPWGLKRDVKAMDRRWKVRGRTFNIP